MVQPKRPTRRQQLNQQRKQKRSKFRHAVTRFRGKRARGKETVSRIYSQRWEERAISPSVAYRPYTTEQLPSRESTAIYSSEYSPNVKLLKITFWGYKQRSVGSTYVYYGVPQDVWVAFMEASSKGRFFWAFIRGQYKYTRVG